MLRIISMILSLITVFVISSAAEIVPFNGKTTNEIMNRLPILFAPAKYASIIWIFIYLLLFAWLYKFWTTHQQISKSLVNLRTILFLLSTILNVCWITLWHYEFYHWTLFIVILLLATLTGLYFSYPKTENHLLERVPISLYFGWVIISFILMINYILTLHEWSGFGISNALWTVIFLTFATAVALHFLVHHHDIAFNTMFMWMFVGIAVKNGFDSLFVTTAALFLTAVIFVCFLLIKNKQQAKI